jgi:hypothetical protein
MVLWRRGGSGFAGGSALLGFLGWMDCCGGCFEGRGFGSGWWCGVLTSCDGVLCGGLCVSNVSVVIHVNVVILSSLL